MPSWDEWDHVTKIDPDKALAGDDTFEDVCATGTDAIEIGGTTGMTEEKMERVIEACSAHDVPLYQEPSNPAVVVESPALDGYLVPTVFNAGDTFWVTGAHKEWARIDDLDWERTTTEAYIVMNDEAAVAEYTGADCDQTPADVAAYARVAERLFGQQIVYVEYSGTFGDPEVVAAATDACEDATVFYGGGIGDYETARTMGSRADVIVVGDLIHEAGADAVAETVRGASEATPPEAEPEAE
ncbi:geranylgeranylglyceryl/heptaprenylglyceryl phosphate synthase [Halobacteriales archaeon SW_7_68_16]|nr:MAG: geranylgeranylglyceryl/heptaprenylglyceryl phosphate synthase [Halobacteriales archaeon SW_7_68_16]